MNPTQLTALIQALLTSVHNTEFDVTVEQLIAEAGLDLASLDHGDGQIRRVVSFEDAGVMTRDLGLVVRLNSGDSLQVTVVEGRSW